LPERIIVSVTALLPHIDQQGRQVLAGMTLQNKNFYRGMSEPSEASVFRVVSPEYASIGSHTV
jgi:hypothetical protein